MADINLGVGAANSATGGYEIDNSLKFESDNSEYLSKTFASAGNRKAWTWSAWVKRTELNSTTTYQQLFSAGTGNPPRDVFFFDDDTDDTLCFFSYGGLFSSATLGFRTDAFFRDTSAWYHIVLVLDTANSTAADRLKLYVNGVSQTFSTYNAPTQNADSLINSNTDHAIGRDESTNAQYFNGYMAEVNFVDGSALAPTDFGEYDSDSGIWKPKEYTGSYGTNGFYLDFEDSSSLGADDSGNSNNFTLNNIAAADQATDTPTNNFCTMNINFKTNDNIVVSEGQTKVTCGSGTGWLSNVGTFALTKGKWYWELASVTSVYQMFGIADASDSIIPQAAGGYYLGYGSNDTTLSVGMYMINGSIYGNQDGGSGVGIAPGAVGDVYGVALDLDNLGFYIIRNGVSPSGSDPSSGSSLTGAVTWNDSIYSGYYYPAVSVFQGNGLEMNFGGYTSNPIASAASDANGYGNFEYAPPSGYYAICTKNLAEYG